MLTGLKEILALTRDRDFAIPAFNTYNMETVMGVIAAAEESRSPVVIQAYSRLFTEPEGGYLAPIILKAAQTSPVPVCFHLDHGASRDVVMKAIKLGASGVMLDVSMLGFAENTAKTKEIAELCGAIGIGVEGELGHIGTTADDHSSEYTDPAQAAEFSEETGVAALAIMVGTAHGRYKKLPQLDVWRIQRTAALTETPLVLHGGSGVPDDQIEAAIAAGIKKINFGTDLCYAFLDEVFLTDRKVYAIDLFMKNAVQSVKRYAISKIRLLRAENRV